VDDAIQAARSEFLASFRWTGGHADFAGVLRNPAFLHVIGSALADPFREAEASAVVGLEARGFVLAGLTAKALGVGLVLARKPGSVHPDAETERAATPDWRGRLVELHMARTAIEPGERVLLVDDWVETGSQAMTVRRLVERLSGRMIGVSAVVDDASDDTRASLSVVGLVASSELPADT
jgi:adenine phosphoribosyltransferase